MMHYGQLACCPTSLLMSLEGTFMLLCSPRLWVSTQDIDNEHADMSSFTSYPSIFSHLYCDHFSIACNLVLSWSAIAFGAGHLVTISEIRARQTQTRCYSITLYPRDQLRYGSNE